MNQGDASTRIAVVSGEQEAEFDETAYRARELSLSRRLAYGILRLSLGINMFIHGAGRVHTGVEAFASRAAKPFADNVLPMSLVHLFLVSLPAIEIVIGILLIFGLWTLWGLGAEGLLLTVLLFGTALRADFVVNAGNPAAVTLVSQQMIYLLTFYALLAMMRYNHFSIDTLIARRRKS